MKNILLFKGCPIEMENTVKLLCMASAPDLQRIAGTEDEQ
jgi:hypothetical protein